jgi:Zn-dependent protease
MTQGRRPIRLEEDPFERVKEPPSTQGQSRGRPVRVVIQSGQGSPFEPFMRGFFDVGGPSVTPHKGSLFHFSERELKDLAMATLAFSFAISLVMHGGIFNMMGLPLGALLISLVRSTVFALAGLAPAFVLHELAHKYVARHFGCWAEFRADPRGLKIGVLIALVIGFVFMAPGAVMVAGRVGKKENGIIALAGPISNILLFIFGLLAGGLLISMTSVGWVADLVVFWLWGNAILGAFNMLPFGPLDGRKVKDWSDPIFWTFLSLTIGLVYLVFSGKAIEMLQYISNLF